MLEVNRTKNIKLMTYSEVKNITGYVGNYEVEILRKPRYTTDKCNGCGACTKLCPASAPSEFNQNLGIRTAIYIAFAQAVPMVAQIDMDHCIKCGLCESVCELKAIDFNQQPIIEKIKVGTIIMATGWDEYKPEYGYLGYGIYNNVITQLELERILAPNGPTFGHLIRPSDGDEPKRILFVQCVGSRDLRRNPYCSSGVCCMISIKNSKLIKQHYPDADITIAYIDIRAAGKSYEEYYSETRRYGIHFIKSSIASIKEDPITKNLKVIMGDMVSNNQQMKEYEFDLVILSCGMNPANGIEELNNIIKLERSPDGFFKEYHSRLNPVDTNMAGIVLAGAAHGPKSIAETIMQSKGAASSASLLLSAKSYVIKMVKAVVDEDRCSQCGLCVNNCPYYAISLNEKNIATIDEIKCRGCGICAMTCPSSTITVRNARNQQFNAVLDNLLT